MNIDEFILHNGEKCVLKAVKESLLRKSKRMNQYGPYMISASNSVQLAIDVLEELASYFNEFRGPNPNTDELVNLLKKELNEVIDE